MDSRRVPCTHIQILGKELDSLSDLVTFGVAPGIIVFNLMSGWTEYLQWLPWTALLIPVAGAIRLARFNIDTRQTTLFIGMPIPANAIFWIGYTATFMNGADSLFSSLLYFFRCF